jgi:hypothetical protein
MWFPPMRGEGLRSEKVPTYGGEDPMRDVIPTCEW